MISGATAAGARLWCVVLSAAYCIGGVPAAAVAAVPTPEQGVEHVRHVKAAAYREVLDGYDAAIQTAPQDAALAVARCNYIGSFIDEESGDWVESAPDEYDACQQMLEDRFADAPEARLFKLQTLWGDEAVEAGDALLADAEQWPLPLRRALLVKLSESLAFQDGPQRNQERAGALAVMAVELGDDTLVPEAVEHLAGKGKSAAAIRLLRETSPAKDAWQARRRVEAALAIPERSWARWELSRYARAGFTVSADIAARAQLHAGDAAAARAALDKEGAGNAFYDPVRFDVLLAAGDLRGAAELVDLTDVENVEAQAQRFITLLVRSPSSLLSGSMMVAAMICLIVLALIGLLPGLLLVPAHYRSLIRQSRGQPPRLPVFGAVGLRHAWIGLALMALVPLVVGVLVEPSTVRTLLIGGVPEPVRFFRATLWGTVAGLLCVGIVARKMPLREWVGDWQAMRAGGWVVAIWVGLVAISVLLSVVAHHAGAGAGAGQGVETPNTHVQMMNALAVGGREAVGPFFALALVALLVPVFEELSFRGLLLGGLSRHLSFGWANTIQAALFAAIHDDPPRLPFYFAMGLTAGWLARKTRSLGPSIALHALNNLVAFSLRLF